MLSRVGILAATVFLAGSVKASAAETTEPTGIGDLAEQILEATGVQGGLIVHVGCGDGRLTAALCSSEGFIVHGLDADAQSLTKAREHIRSLGLCGKVCVERWDGRRLPFADNLVNLLLVENPGGVDVDEMLRVLVPRGVAYVKSDDGWKKTVKPWPDEIDEWSHYLHDATGNAVAHDRLVAAPSRLQWIGGPLWSRSHEYDSSLSVMVSAHGRLFYIFDEGPTGIIDMRVPDKWKLIARDAFNGVVLWKREVPDWGWKAWKRAEMEQTDWRRMGSQRFRIPVSVSRRLVAAGDCVYATLGYEAPLTALDAATGRTVRTYADTERTDEIVHENGLLALCIRTKMQEPPSPAGKRGRPGNREAGAGLLVALEADTGRRLWQTERGTIVPLSLALSKPHVYYHDRDAVVCLDAATGQQCWRTPTGVAGNSVWNTDTTLVVHENLLLCLDRKQLTALSVADGKPLWKLPGARGWGIANPPDLFIADGTLWYGRENLHAERITGYDPLTGKPTRTVDLKGVITRGHHARCYRSRATDNYLLLPKRAVEFIDIHGGNHSRNNWARGACRYGVLPCNGLLYTTPHPCFCYAGVKLGGFVAMAGGEKAESRKQKAEDAPQLECGPAYAAIPNPDSAIRNPVDWATYRHDPKRSGSSSMAVDAGVQPAWSVRLGGKLAQSIVVGRQVFATRVDAGQICCLDALTGKPVWDYMAGGRIDSPPTYHAGRLIFGSADGCVYCLRASDGVLAWRFRAAPQERRVVAFGQVESAWPVHGSVLVMNDTVYFTAGRSSFLDGGITIYGLDPATGKTRYKTRLDGPSEDITKLDEAAYTMEGSKSDILVTDGRLIYLFHNAFNQRLEKQPTPVKGKLDVRNLGVRDFGGHLFSNAGFLDDSWFSRSYWMYGDRWPAFNFAHQSPKAGQLLVFDQQRTYAVRCFARRNMLSPLFFPATDGYFLFADRNDTRPVLVASDGKGGPEFLRWLPQSGELQTCWNLGVGFARAKPAEWMTNVPVRIRAMVRTADVLFAAGPPDLCDPKDPTGALEGRRGAMLMAFDPADGRKLSEYKLDAPPVFDGLSASTGRLYLSATDGSVTCLSGNRKTNRGSK